MNETLYKQVKVALNAVSVPLRGKDSHEHHPIGNGPLADDQRFRPLAGKR